MAALKHRSPQLKSEGAVIAGTNGAKFTHGNKVVKSGQTRADFTQNPGGTLY